ncbi:MAG: outer membrane protein assembly factor BamA [Betaproteobacteria bacterium]|nr:outer membrane protein assembly factor BamA [Betaproteobacteria bacterium]MDE2212084.1 outer membrane protein assembly factor BamA [Betaproteobacteria bacterium]
MTFRTFIVLCCMFLSATAWAVAPFTIKDIRVEGAQRIEAGTIFSYLPLKVGDSVTPEKSAAAIKSLYDTGFFADVKLEKDGDVLVVVVQERPSIYHVDINGAKSFNKDQLRDALKSIGIAESRIYDKSLLDKAEKELKRQYLSKGKYSAQVTTTVTPMTRNRVSLTFNIVEGEVAHIREITIVGAKAFPEKVLQDQLQLNTPDWFSWYTKNDQYSKQKLSGDLETLRSYYQDRGYLEFAVDSTQVSISPDKQDIYITINITEGQQYKVSEVKLAGQFVVPEEELRKLVTLKPGDIFSREKVTTSSKAISDRLANDGYSFANINATPEINKEKRTAAFTFVIDPGRRVYVRHVNIFGNTTTRDEVVRREVRQLEGGWYSIQKVNRSKERIDRLGFFSEVTVDSPPVPGTTDQVDVNFTVVERQTGSVQVGAGYSSAEKVVLSAGITQNNLFGSGNSISLNVNSGAITRTYSLSYTNPYWTDEGIGRSWTLYDTTMNTTFLTGVSPYMTRTLGGGMHLAVPLSETNAYSVGLGFESTAISVVSNSPIQYLDFVNQFGDTAKTIKADVGFSKDSRDSVIFPMKGMNQRYSLEMGLPGADLKYYRATVNEQLLTPVSKDTTVSLSGQFGYGNGYNGMPLPFFKNFFAGGVDSVRGYFTGSLGPHTFDIVGNTLNLGGNKLITGSAEYLFPMPGMRNDHSFRLSTFVDAGNVFGGGEPVSFGQLRYSSGVALSWYSPMGPLKFSYAVPIRAQPFDNIERLQFQLGSTF